MAFVVKNTEIYTYILSRIEEDVLAMGFRRSGKGVLFYRYSADKQIASGIEMQKSAYSSEDHCVFTFNITCIAAHHVSPRPKQLTLAHIKVALRTKFERIGPAWSAGKGWWEITGEYLEEYGLEGYYDRFVRKEILKCGRYLSDKMALF